MNLKSWGACAGILGGLVMYGATVGFSDDVKENSLEFIVNESEVSNSLYRDLNFYFDGSKMHVDTGGHFESQIEIECFEFSGEYNAENRLVSYSISDEVKNNNTKGEVEKCLLDLLRKATIATGIEIRKYSDKKDKEEALQLRHEEIKASWENG